MWQQRGIYTGKFPTKYGLTATLAHLRVAVLKFKCAHIVPHTNQSVSSLFTLQNKELLHLGTYIVHAFYCTLPEVIK